MVACFAVDVRRISQYSAGGYRQRDRRYLFFVRFFFMCTFRIICGRIMSENVHNASVYRRSYIWYTAKNICCFLSANRKGFICFDQIHAARQISSRQRRIVSSLLELPSDTRIGRIYTIFIRFFLHYFICLRRVSDTAVAALLVPKILNSLFSNR